MFVSENIHNLKLTSTRYDERELRVSSIDTQCYIVVIRVDLIIRSLSMLSFFFWCNDVTSLSKVRKELMSKNMFDPATCECVFRLVAAFDCNLSYFLSFYILNQVIVFLFFTFCNTVAWSWIIVAPSSLRGEFFFQTPIPHLLS